MGLCPSPRPGQGRSPVRRGAYAAHGSGDARAVPEGRTAPNAGMCAARQRGRRLGRARGPGGRSCALHGASRCPGTRILDGPRTPRRARRATARATIRPGPGSGAGSVPRGCAPRGAELPPGGVWGGAPVSGSGGPPHAPGRRGRVGEQARRRPTRTHPTPKGRAQDSRVLGPALWCDACRRLRAHRARGRRQLSSSSIRKPRIGDGACCIGCGACGRTGAIGWVIAGDICCWPP